MGKSAKLRDIVVLGLLKEQPRYGYEIKMIIDHVMSHIIDISSGSLYYGIKKLQQSGCIEEASVEKVGRRPERSVYKITDAGLKLLDRELPKVIFPQARPTFPLNLGLYFFDVIGSGERQRRLRMWLERIDLTISFLEELKLRYKDEASQSHLLILDHNLCYYRAEQVFLADAIGHLFDNHEYQLTPQDREEVEAEIEKLRQQLNYDARNIAPGTTDKLTKS